MLKLESYSQSSIKSGFWLVVFALIAIPIISIGDNLGLYFDSVFPDYAATQLLDRQEHEYRWFAAWPILVQYYHGNVSMFVSALVIMIFGSANVIQHRLINAGIITICFYIIDKIFEKHGIMCRVRQAMIIMFSFMPAMLGFCLTQYFIELPGIVFSLMSFFLLIQNDEISNVKLWISFALLGMAFYSYFNYLFLFPGFLILALWNKKNKLARLIVSCLGMLPGVSLYIIGYIKVLYKGFSDTNFVIFFIVYVIALVLFENIMYRFAVNGKEKVCLAVGVFFAIAAMVCCALLKNNLLLLLNDINVVGASSSFAGRIKAIGQNFYFAVSGVSAELLMFGYQVTVYEKATLIMFAIITAAYLLLMCISVKFRNDSTAWKYLMIIVIYLLCCIPLVTRMQTQHFVPMCFMGLLAVVVELHEIVRYAVERFSINERYSVLAAMVFIFFFSFLYTKDRYAVMDEIYETGGNGYYTNQLNKLADEALENLSRGKKEIYVFPEWGFMAGFNYMTNNNVPFSSEASKENFEKLLDEGYDLQILYWNEEDTDKYIEKLGNKYAQKTETHEYIGYEGTADFYRIEVKKGD